MIKKTLTIASTIAIFAGAASLLAAWGLGAKGMITFGRGGFRISGQRAEARLTQRGIEGVASLSVDAVGADIEFIPAADFGFDILTYDAEPSWSLEGGELAIVEHADWYDATFKFSLPFFFEDDPDARIKVYYPECAALDRLAASTVSGSIAFPGLGEKLREAAFSTTSGNIGVASLEADALTLKTVSGDIQARGVSSPRASLPATSGNAAISGFSGALGAESVSGRVEIAAPDEPGSPGVELDIRTTSGDVSIAAGALFGDIGTVRGNVEITAGTLSGNIGTTSGKIGISTSAGEDLLAYEIETTSGEITVGGRRLGNPARSAPARAGAPMLSLETVSGDVDIAFR
jgi:hypothetical protein